MDFASRIAPEIDRLVLAVNTAAERQSLPTLEGMAESVGLGTPELLKHYADFLLEGRLTEDLAVTRLPYHPAEVVRERLATWGDLGLVVPTEDGLGAVDALVPLLEAIIDGRRRVATELWEGRPSLQPALDGVGLALAATPDRFHLAAAHRDLRDPDDPNLRLHTRLTTCRYVRSQAHAAAWRHHGLSRSEILALTALWHGDSSADGQALGALAERRLVDLADSSLTDEGRRVREEIEAETNRSTAPMFEAIGDESRAALADSLAALPGVPS